LIIFSLIFYSKEYTILGMQELKLLHSLPHPNLHIVLKQIFKYMLQQLKQYFIQIHQKDILGYLWVRTF